MTDTAPNVSTVFNDLHKILFFFMRFAQMVKLAVRAIGSPSGMNAIATLTQSTIRVGTLIQSGWLLRSQDALGVTISLFALWKTIIGDASSYQTIMTTMIIVSMIETMMTTKLKISRSKVVIPVLGSFVSLAMRPKTVLSPVATTTPIALPEIQCVPCIPIQRVSR